MTKPRGERLIAQKQAEQEKKKNEEIEKKLAEKQRRKVISKKKVTVMKKKRDAAKQRRAALKENKDLYEEKKRMERERWHRRVAEGRIKALSEMSDRDRRCAQKKRREINKRYYANRKKKETEEVKLSAPSEIEQTLTTSRKKSGRKKVQANRSAVRRNLVKQIQENKTLRRNLWRVQKKLQKAKKMLPISPRTKINKEFRGKRLSPGMQRRLVFNEVILKQLRQSLNLKSLREKQAAYKIFSGSLIRHYKLQKPLGLSTTLLRKYHNKPKPLQYQRTPKKEAVTNREKVEKFFVSEEASIESPGKNAFKIQYGSKKLKKRKRYLRGSLKDLYISYCQSDESPVCYSKFCNLKPFYVVTKDLKERDTCLCEQRENMSLLIKALNKAKAIDLSSTLSLIQSMYKLVIFENYVK